jgi:hypothetical protein
MRRALLGHVDHVVVEPRRARDLGQAVLTEHLADTHRYLLARLGKTLATVADELRFTGDFAELRRSPSWRPSSAPSCSASTARTWCAPPRSPGSGRTSRASCGSSSRRRSPARSSSAGDNAARFRAWLAGEPSRPRNLLVARDTKDDYPGYLIGIYR